MGAQINKRDITRPGRKRRRETGRDWKRSRERENSLRSRKKRKRRRRRSPWLSKRRCSRRWKRKEESKRRKVACSDECG